MIRNNNNELKLFFINRLENVYAIHGYINSELPYMIDAAVGEDVKAVLEVHRCNSFRQQLRTTAIFDHLHLSPHRKRVPVVKRMVRQAKRQIKRTNACPVVRDAGLIITWRGIDHFVISSYSGLLSLSSSLGFNKISQSLYVAMDEEMEVDTNLNEVLCNYPASASEESRTNKFI